MGILRGLTTYFREARDELRKVVWPTRRETVNHTLIVIGVSVAVGVFLGLLDYLFQQVLQRII